MSTCYHYSAIPRLCKKYIILLKQTELRRSESAINAIYYFLCCLPPGPRKVKSFMHPKGIEKHGILVIDVVPARARNMFPVERAILINGSTPERCQEAPALPITLSKIWCGYSTNWERKSRVHHHIVAPYSRLSARPL